MDGVDFLQDLAIVLLGAGIAGALCKRIGLSVIVGYLLAGILIGPYTPPFSFIQDVARIETLSQIGLVFLMFAIGLGLSLTKLQKLGLATVGATALAAFLVFSAVQQLAQALGWSPAQGLFVAGMLMVSSSAVIAKIVKDMNLGHMPSGQTALGMTVLEDVVAVVMLAILGAQTATTSGQLGVGSLLTGLMTFVVLVVIAGLLLLPRVLRRVSAKADPELQTIVVAGLLFLMAILSVKAGYSLALGAFLLGAVVADMPQKSGVETSFAGVRDMFSSVFFVAIGMMIDVQLLVSVWPWVLGLGLFTLVVRAVAVGTALMVFAVPPDEARRAGLLLLPLGEFTFVIAQMGVAAQVLPPALYPVAVGVSLLTVLIAPLINRHAETLLTALNRIEPSWVRRFFNAYHHWMVQLVDNQGGRLWWQHSKKRLAYSVLEGLFVSGVLIFSRRLLTALQDTAVTDYLSTEILTLTYWAVIFLLVLVPLLAIWFNISALAQMISRSVGNRPRFLAPIVDNGIKAFGLLVMAIWLLSVVPVRELSWWVWAGVIAGVIVVLTIFSRRLLFWHSQWQQSIEGAFGETPPDETAQQRSWLQGTASWKILVQEMILPEGAACSGQSISDLQIRARYGCSVVEIDRGGHLIVAPGPEQKLYSRDRLLLLGTQEQLAAARSGLEEVRPAPEQAAFDNARLETVTVPAGPRVGLPLAELEILQKVGVLVTGIRRQGSAIINPVGTDRLAEGDELLILGSPQQLRHFKVWLQYFAINEESEAQEQGFRQPEVFPRRHN